MSPLFTPEPVEVAPQVLAAQARPMLPASSQEFIDLIRRTEEKCRLVFQTNRPVFLLTGNGSLMQEAAVRNFAPRSILCCVNGAYSRRWAEIAEANGVQVDLLEVEWGEAIQPDQIKTALARGNYDTISLVHVELSTGVQNPLEELVSTTRLTNPNTLVLIDASGSLAGIPINTDALEADFIFTSSDKCLGLPPGLALASASSKALEIAEKTNHRGYAYDFVSLEKQYRQFSLVESPPQGLLFALDAQLDRLIEKGLANHYQQIQEFSSQIAAWLQEHGFQLFAADDLNATTLLCVRNRYGWSFAELDRFLLTRGIRIANGYGMLKEKTFRIAIMGDIQSSVVTALLTALEDFYQKIGRL